MKFILKSPEETIELGKQIGERLQGGELFLLEGDLGGGKTQFTKGLALGLCVDETVISPTFTIERIYNGKELELHHFDFYRLNGIDQEMTEEVEELIKDSRNVIVIEWPMNLNFKLPESYFELKFGYIDENIRSLNTDIHGSKYKNILENL